MVPYQYYNELHQIKTSVLRWTFNEPRQNKEQCHIRSSETGKYSQFDQYEALTEARYCPLNRGSARAWGYRITTQKAESVRLHTNSVEAPDPHSIPCRGRWTDECRSQCMHSCPSYKMAPASHGSATACSDIKHVGASKQSTSTALCTRPLNWVRWFSLGEILFLLFSTAIVYQYCSHLCTYICSCLDSTTTDTRTSIVPDKNNSYVPTRSNTSWKRN